MMLKKKMTRSNVLLFSNVDIAFGISALFTVITGLLRVYYFGKGINYYMGNSFFVLKFSLFILVGICSIFPTMHFLKKRKLKNEVIELNYYPLLRFIILLELIIIVILPLLASFMARGVNF